MPEANYATIHVYDFQRLVLADYELKKAGWSFKEDQWAAPETAQTVVKYPAGVAVNISGVTSAEQATLRAACGGKAAIKHAVSSVVEKAEKDMVSALVQRAVETAEEATRRVEVYDDQRHVQQLVHKELNRDQNRRINALEDAMKDAFGDKGEGKNEHTKNLEDAFNRAIDKVFHNALKPGGILHKY